jgi:hypothetical protein
MIRRTFPAGVLALLAAVVGLATGIQIAHAQTPVFINEIHYDNAGDDTGEAVEIAGPAGTDISGWRIVRYNGESSPNPGMVYTSPAAPQETLPPGTMIPPVCETFGVFVIGYPLNGLQNGPMDAIALVDSAGAVVQFLSYEGTVTAANGPAVGLTSTNIGVTEPGTTPVGRSLQLQGTGAFYGDFAWAAPIPHTFGLCNTGQVFTGEDVAPIVAQTVPAHGSVGVARDTPISITFSEPVTTEAAAFSIDCGAGAISFALGGGPQTYTLTPALPLPSLATCMVTVLAAGVTDQNGAPDHPED